MTNIQYFKSAIDAPGCISNGWNLIKLNYWMYFAIGLLSWVIISCVPCVNIFLLGPILTGVYFVLLREMRVEPVEFGMMFKGFEKFVPAMVVGLIQSIPGILWQIVKFTTDIARVISEIRRGATRGGGDFFQSSGDGTDIAIAGGLFVVYLVIIVVLMIFSLAWAISFTFALPLLAEPILGLSRRSSLVRRPHGATSAEFCFCCCCMFCWLLQE